MGRSESTEPVDVVDPLLWRDAQQMLGRHAGPGPDDRCEWCGWEWPCPPRRLAERAAAASRGQWQETWAPVRPELNHKELNQNLRALPDWRPEQRHPGNGGLFD